MLAVLNRKANFTESTKDEYMKICPQKGLYLRGRKKSEVVNVGNT